MTDVFGDDVKDSLPSKVDIVDEDEKDFLPIVETPKENQVEIPIPVSEIEEQPKDDSSDLKIEAETKTAEISVPKSETQNEKQSSPDKTKSALRRKKPVEAVEPKRNQSSRVVERTPLKTVENTNEQSEPATQLKPPAVRPSSARPGAPRLKENTNVDVIINKSEPLAVGKVNIIVESYEKEKQEVS